ncbi:DNA-3-methyladenine glycosylase [Acidothermaceae bacterium B102]|nr:DNA-3-methyladenine glycosylase [Acidothermaceae bacterium B102]
MWSTLVRMVASLVPDLVWTPGYPLDLRLTLGPLLRGRGDPTQVVDEAGRWWRACRTPEGIGTLVLAQVGDRVAARAWGPGADWLLRGVPDLLGVRDEPAAFVAHHPGVAEALRRHPGLRVPRTGLVMEALVPAILEQLVTGTEAKASWRQLVARFGEPAPGPVPTGLTVMPAPSAWVNLPDWEWHRAGLDGRRRVTLVAAARVAPALERTVALAPVEAKRVLRTVPGIGVWTAAEVACRAFGDVDAVSVGDYHLAAQVGWALLGRPVDDQGMLELLEPYRPQRQRAIRLILMSGPGKPRFAPRYAPRDNRTL